VPVTSSRSSLKRWPSAELPLASAGAWARRLADGEPSVPADVLHYTEGELRDLLERGGRMATVVEREARWWVGGPPRPGGPPLTP
jgi:hypothetical protein